MFSCFSIIDQLLFNCCSFVVQLTSCIIFGIRVERFSFTAVNMPPKRGAGIGRERPEENAVLLEEIQSLHTSMDTMETV